MIEIKASTLYGISVGFIVLAILAMLFNIILNLHNDREILYRFTSPGFIIPVIFLIIFSGISFFFAFKK